MQDMDELNKKKKDDSNSDATGNDNSSSGRALRAIQQLRIYQEKARQDRNLIYERERQRNLEEDLKEANKIKDLKQRNESVKLIEYESTYELMKFEKKEIFNKKGKLLKKFNIDDLSSIDLKEDDGEYFLEYHEEGKEPYAVTKDFKTKDEAIKSLFGTCEYEILRDRTLFKLDKGTCIYLKDNKDKIRLNSFKTGDLKFNTTDINNARRKILLESLENKPSVRKQLIGKTLKHFDVESKGLDFKNTDNINKAKEKIINNLQNNERINKIKTEVKNDSHSFLEGFLEFYGIQLNKRLDETRQPFEIVNSRKGYSIGKYNRKGELKRVSPYFRQEEAVRNLNELNNYIEMKKKREISKNLDLKNGKVK